ncbi:MAG: TonB-dependent receptor [Saprospiraceae bacterium]|nr:TonB-dependent receptor [Saprospiraceae bacterium]
MKKVLQLLAMLLCVAFTANAQTKTVSGTVTDGGGAALPGVSVVVKGTTTGAITDLDGKFSIKAPAAATTITLSFVGFKTTDAAIPPSGTVDVVLASSDNELEAVVVTTGSRNTQRTVTDSSLPIDILSSKDLLSTGQTSFDKALQYRVPSFNTVNTPVNDATTLLDPYEIRNMGPSRSLILINGKRKNLSSLLYVQFSPGRGEVGADISAIPTEAIKRVEILRDGASAQYGSDAIAGVMNIILKDKYEYSSLTIGAGSTLSKGNEVRTTLPGGGYGGTYNVALNSGSNLGGKGFLNYTMAFSQQNTASRSGIIDVPTEIATFGGGAAQDALITKYLGDFPTGNNVNGTGDITAAKFNINAGVKISDKGEIYGNGAFVTKKVSSFANFRTPYWRQDHGLLHKSTDNNSFNYITAATLANAGESVDLYRGYIGYVPTFEGDLTDYNATIGVRDEIGGWKTDLSLTTGGNTQLYTVNNTVNRGFAGASPTRFKPGGYNFNHTVGNLDVSKSVNDQLSLAFGVEGRTESYSIYAGDTASYKGQGANSFPGIDAVNASTNSRFNVGAYLDASYDVTKDFLVNATVRGEKYSDFGNAGVYKLSSRYKFAEDKVTLRGSFSTGFRAPSLHQVYAQSIQANFSGGTITTSGLYNNQSAQARLLGIPTLKPERSTNVTLGLGLNPVKNLSVTLDYYQINVKDRIVYSSSISSKNPTSTLGQILSKADIGTIQFFINGIETNTSGLDYVVSYRNIALGTGKLHVNLAGNINLKNEIVGTPNEPDAIKADNSSILNAQIKSLLTESRPQYKSILGFDYVIGKAVINLNNTLFGPTKFRDIDNGGAQMNYIQAVFKPAVVTDLNIGYNFTDKVNFSLGINNIFNVLPKWDLEANTIAGAPVAGEAAAKATLADPKAKALLRGFLGFSGRYDILGYNGSQFSQLGTVVNGQLTVKF